MSVRLTGMSALVSLGPGHVAQTRVPVARRRGRVRFTVPGLPTGVSFSLKLSGNRLTGTAIQAGARARVALMRGRSSRDTRLGYFSTAGGPVEVARFTRYGYSTEPFGIDLDTGAFGAIPSGGSRTDVHQFEVRFKSGSATLAGTLTLPPGAGPFPAAVYVSGSGDTLREEAQWLGGLFVSHGIALLAYDKRGVGQSGGHYPGSLAGDSTIGILSGDAVAAVRFLASRPEIDHARTGFFGLSQGGWIIPQALVRSQGTASWAIVESGPTVTQGEADAFAGMATSGTSIPEAEAEARQLGSSGYDPVPWIRQVTVPVLWLYGGQDRAQPAGSSMSILQTLMPGHDFEVSFYADAPHPLFTQGGFAPGLFDRVSGWLAAHHVSSTG